MYLSVVVEDKHWQIHRSTRTGTDFEKPVPLPEIDAPGFQHGVTATADDLTLYFSSNRPLQPTGALNANIYVATRRTASERFGAPRPVDELNDKSYDVVSWVSPDGCRLYFASARTGSNRIYVAAKP